MSLFKLGGCCISDYCLGGSLQIAMKGVSRKPKLPPYRACNASLKTRIRGFLMGVGALSFAGLAQAESTSVLTFEQCVAQLSDRARSEGVPQPVLDSSLAKVQYSAKVIELDRQQPEFTTTFADYLTRRVTEQRVEQGRALLDKHSDLLPRIAKEYGVPAHYLVAFWGLETNFGSFFGRMSVLDSLATLACDPRRSSYFSRELMAALKIIDEGAVAPAQMEGSWAGAMGHVQFMPSVFLRYAVDYDNDGRRDLWGSLPDALASGANFLNHLGWRPGARWGREVRLPKDFPYLEAGLDTRKPLAEWRLLGVRKADGGALPIADFEASLLVPAGHNGPAFLVYENFKTIMGWNQSEYYALAVGLLADRIAGSSGLQQSLPEDAPRLSRTQVIQLQETLNRKGFDSGEPDGIMGPATRRALRAYQADQKRVADGFADAEVLKGLGVISVEQ